MFSLWISASWRTKESVSEVSRSGQRMKMSRQKVVMQYAWKMLTWLAVIDSQATKAWAGWKEHKTRMRHRRQKKREVRTLSVSSHSRVPIHVSAGNKLAQRRDFPEKNCILRFNPIKYANAHLIQILIYFQIPVKSGRQVVASRVVFNLTIWELQKWLETYTSPGPTAPHSASNDIIRPADDGSLCCCQIILTIAPLVLLEVVYNARGSILMKMLSTTECNRILPFNFIPPGQPVTPANIP